MSNKSWVDKNHYRVTSNDGRKSYLYETDNSLFGPDKCVEVAEHHQDGTTDAYEYDPSFTASIFHGCKGKHK